MVTPDLIQFIAKQLKAGKSLTEIRAKLKTEGWSDADITEGIEKAESVKDVSIPNVPSDMPADESFYPIISAKRIENPSRLYAFPILGFVIKVVMLILPAFYLGIISLAMGIGMIINPFVVLFTGKLWPPYIGYVERYIKYSTKLAFFMYGLTNKYPGFKTENDDPMVSVSITHTENPSKLYAIPLIGFIIRLVLLIPYLIFESVVMYTTYIVFFVSSFPVLFLGRYPETSFELVRDYLRISHASTLYMGGFSDKYPSFWISMNHKTMKIILLVLGALWMLLGFAGEIVDTMNPQKNDTTTQYEQQLDESMQQLPSEQELENMYESSEYNTN
jgi:hypothetical protein